MPLFPSPRRPPQGALLDAVMNDNIGEVRRLLRLGSDVNELDTLGNTPLARAVSYGYADIVSLLLENHANIDNQNKQGNTPLILAVINSYGVAKTAIIRLLLDKGANMDLRNSRNDTALDIAVVQSRYQAIDILKEALAKRKRLAEEFERAAEQKRREQIDKSQQELKDLSKKRPRPHLVPKQPPPTV